MSNSIHKMQKEIRQLQNDGEKMKTDIRRLAGVNRTLALRHMAVEREVCKGGWRMLALLVSGRLLTSVSKSENEIMEEGKKC